MAARKNPDEQSWDDFWAERSKGPATTIRGIKVHAPTDVQLSMLRRLQELHDSTDPADVFELVAGLFGADVFDEWEAAGMGVQELRAVLAWGMSHARGNPKTFAEAVALVEEEQAEGKAAPPNRASRRAASKSRSAAGGGPSKRTSSASTGSARTRSRA